MATGTSRTVRASGVAVTLVLGSGLVGSGAASDTASAPAAPEPQRAANVVEPLAPGQRFPREVRPDGSIIVAGETFADWKAFLESGFFRDNGLRCGTPQVNPDDFAGNLPEGAGGGGVAGGSAGDCGATFTNPAAIYAPSVVLYRIPVVIHVIRASNGITGNLTQARIDSQMQILNEDFKAIPGSNGQFGTDVQIEFYLATADENGTPSSGVTYHNNDTWFADGGSYWNTIAANWDPTRFLNIYTNNTTSLGYVPFLPQTGSPGSIADRVVVYYEAFGNNPSFPPFHLGRTATHEIGHYLGLYHTFQSCGTASCYSSGDYICDTNAHSSPQFGCPPNGAQCFDGAPDPFRAYMNYTDDNCMQLFTPEQARRMRCTLEHWRPLLYDIGEPAPPNDTCENAINVSDGSTPFNNLNANTDGPAEPAQCNFFSYDQVGADVWYKYAATCNGLVTLNLCSSGYDTKVAVYAGSCPTMASAIACNDDSDTCGPGSTRSHVTFTAAAGTVYRIRIGGYQAAEGSGTLTISCALDCPADCLDGDGDVDINDLLNLLATWGQPGSCDINDSGTVDIADLLAMLAEWGPC
jgi:hypothetical protein